MVAIYVSLYNFTLPWGKQLIWVFRHFNPTNKKLLETFCFSEKSHFISKKLLFLFLPSIEMFGGFQSYSVILINLNIA